MAGHLTGTVWDVGICSRCGREPGRIFEVEHDDGTRGTYGRRCCAIITGHRNVEHALRSAQRLAVVEARWVKVLDAFPNIERDQAWHEQVWQVVTTDRLWHGEDADGHDRGFSRCRNWRNAIRKFTPTESRTR